MRRFLPVLLVGLCFPLACAEDAPGLVDPRCVPNGDAPQTIDDAVNRLNELPEPSLACFVASLPRPLRLTAVNSQFSAQPAAGFDRPRVFLHTDGLVLSVALGGEGQNLLEFGEWINETDTIKGEVAFPLQLPLEAEAPFVEVLREGRAGTTCGICHANEEPVRAGVYSSAALAPAPRDEIDLDYLRAVAERCDGQRDPHGCSLLQALFDYGEVRSEEFPDGVRQL